MRRTHQTFAITSLLLLLVGLTAPILAMQEEDVPPIVAHMRKVNENLRTLRGQYDQPSLKQENVQLVETVRTHIQAAQKLEPLKTPEIPESQREDFVKAFRAELDKVLEVLDQLEAALNQEDSASARELILKLYDLREEGHKRFRSED